MEALHAPWRIQYILGPKPDHGDQSVFTAAARSLDDEAHHIIARGRTCFALLNTYPYNGGHVLVLPYKQVSDFDELTDDELLELMKLMIRCKAAIQQTMKPDGFNLGVNLGKVAGAGIVEHLHIHIVPRWQGDTNFMPITAGTTVLPQALAELAAQLRAALAETV